MYEKGILSYFGLSDSFVEVTLGSIVVSTINLVCICVGLAALSLTLRSIGLKFGYQFLIATNATLLLLILPEGNRAATAILSLMLGIIVGATIRKLRLRRKGILEASNALGEHFLSSIRQSLPASALCVLVLLTMMAFVIKFTGWYTSQRTEHLLVRYDNRYYVIVKVNQDSLLLAAVAPDGTLQGGRKYVEKVKIESIHPGFTTRVHGGKAFVAE